MNYYRKLTRRFALSRNLEFLTNNDGSTILTVHYSNGLEFETSFIAVTKDFKN